MSNDTLTAMHRRLLQALQSAGPEGLTTLQLANAADAFLAPGGLPMDPNTACVHVHKMRRLGIGIETTRRYRLTRFAHRAPETEPTNDNGKDGT